MHKSFKNNTMRSMQSLKVMFLTRKFNKIANILRSNKLQASGKNHQNFQSSAPYRKTSLQIKITKEVENL